MKLKRRQVRFRLPDPHQLCRNLAVFLDKAYAARPVPCGHSSGQTELFRPASSTSISHY